MECRLPSRGPCSKVLACNLVAEAEFRSTTTVAIDASQLREVQHDLCESHGGSTVPVPEVDTSETRGVTIGTLLQPAFRQYLFSSPVWPEKHSRDSREVIKSNRNERSEVKRELARPGRALSPPRRKSPSIQRSGTSRSSSDPRGSSRATHALRETLSARRGARCHLSASEAVRRAAKMASPTVAQLTRGGAQSSRATALSSHHFGASNAQANRSAESADAHSASEDDHSPVRRISRLAAWGLPETVPGAKHRSEATPLQRRRAASPARSFSPTRSVPSQNSYRGGFGVPRAVCRAHSSCGFGTQHVPVSREDLQKRSFVPGESMPPPLRQSPPERLHAPEHLEPPHKSLVSVYVRVRPPNAREHGEPRSVHIEGSTISVADPAHMKGQFFEFEDIIDASSCDGRAGAGQHEVFRLVGEQAVHSVLDGFHTCVFALGQTGTGKTYTLIGTPEQPGLLPRVLEHILSEPCRLRLSCLELHLDRVRDLLADEAMERPIPEIRVHPLHGVHISNLNEVSVEETNVAIKLVTMAARSRSVAKTSMNASSSRGHAVFQLSIDGGSKLCIVDLAGRENERATRCSGQTSAEQKYINKSLFHLTNVIQALATPGVGRVPYRNSKLTMLLSDCLQSARSFLLATVSPALSSVDDTLTTLRMAKAVRQIATKTRRTLRSQTPHSKDNYVNVGDAACLQSVTTQAPMASAVPMPFSKPCGEPFDAANFDTRSFGARAGAQAPLPDAWNSSSTKSPSSTPTTSYDSLSASMPTCKASIEAADSDPGASTEASWTPRVGLMEPVCTRTLSAVE